MIQHHRPMKTQGIPTDLMFNRHLLPWGLRALLLGMVLLWSLPATAAVTYVSASAERATCPGHDDAADIGGRSELLDSCDDRSVHIVVQRVPAVGAIQGDHAG